MVSYIEDVGAFVVPSVSFSPLRPKQNLKSFSRLWTILRPLPGYILIRVKLHLIPVRVHSQVFVFWLRLGPFEFADSHRGDQYLNLFETFLPYYPTYYRVWSVIKIHKILKKKNENCINAPNDKNLRRNLESLRKYWSLSRIYKENIF